MPQAQTTEHPTPKATFDALWEEFGGFDLDPCGQKEVHYTAWRIVQRGGHCYDGSTMLLNGLTQPWSGKVFMNPPYGRETLAWVARAHDEVVAGRVELVVALLKSTTDVKWWHQYVEHCPYATPRFIKGRLKFGDSEAPAPFPSVIVVWQPEGSA